MTDPSALHTVEAAIQSLYNAIGDAEASAERKTPHTLERRLELELVISLKARLGSSTAIQAKL